MNIFWHLRYAENYWEFDGYYLVARVGHQIGDYSEEHCISREDVDRGKLADFMLQVASEFFARKQKRDEQRAAWDRQSAEELEREEARRAMLMPEEREIEDRCRREADEKYANSTALERAFVGAVVVPKRGDA